MTAQIAQIAVERFSIVSSLSFESVVSKLEQGIGRPEIGPLMRKTAAAQTAAELADLIGEAVGPSGLMEFIRFDLGQVLRKEPEYGSRKCLRLVIGNPLIMKEMAKHVPDAGSYAPVTVLIDERPDGVHLSYDRMASLLASYGNPPASQVARDLDAKVEALLRAAASA